MKLVRLRVDGFGALAGEWAFDAERVNLIVGENERGKTTLATAIGAALYGLEADKRSWRDKATPLEQYKPWSGRAYALELEFELKGARWLVCRNFGSGKLVVLEGGADKTEEFRVGPGEYKVGEMLLGMSADQFARSALWVQPGPGRWGGDEVRPDGTLTSLLEAMSATKQGDGTAVRAVNALEDALKNYRGRQNSGRIENEIKKLENALGAAEIDLRSAENARSVLAESLARLAEVEDRETSLTGALSASRRADAARRRAEITERLAAEASDRAQLATLKDEIARLEPARTIPQDAAGRLRRAHAEAASAQGELERLAAEREREVGGPRHAAETALAALEPYAWATPGVIEELFSVEKDLERAELEANTARDKRVELEHELAARGISIARLSELAARFGALAGEDRMLLTQYPAQTQAIVSDFDAAQRAIKGGQTVLDDVKRARDRQRIAGFALGAIGVLAGAGSVYLAFLGNVIESFVGLGLTLFALTGSTVLLLRCASHRNADRTDALRQVLDAQRRVGELQMRRREREEQLGGVAERLGFPDVTSLLREHGEFLRLTTESQRSNWLDEDVRRAGDKRQTAGAAVRSLALRAGLTETDAPHELVARLRQGVGSVLDARAKLEQLSAAARRLDAQESDARVRLTAAKNDAQALASSLGLSNDGDDRALADAVERRTRERARLLSLETDLVPTLEKRLLTAETRGALEAERVRLEAEAGPSAGAGGAGLGAPAAETGGRGAADIESELAPLRRERLELTSKVGGRDRESAESIARAFAERAELKEALAQARAFKEAVEIARDRFQSVARETHARWSENLSTRVDELLARFGLAHSGFQISDKLEISLHAGGERLVAQRLEQALSAGARDQVTLALRVAICEYLARGGERLPLVLDDPFASADDSRAARLLPALVEVVRAGHPVVVLTCHRTKVDALRGSDPAWFEKAVNCLPFVESGAEAGPRTA